ncbi:hypothetical protein [Nocardia africana]
MRALGKYLVAWICDLVIGASGGMINVNGWHEEFYRMEREAADMQRRVARLEESVNPAPRPFEAYTDCPKCGHMDHHWLRAPHTELVPMNAAAWREMKDSGNWGPPMMPNAEAAFETIRICTDCGHEWGML